MYLAPYGYTSVTYTPGMWKHYSYTLHFSLVIDNFGIKYLIKVHSNHLLQIIMTKHTISAN